MKKLMFAAAIAASAAAFADPINAISFENSQYASIDNATNLTGKADIPDPGRESATGATGYYFLYEAQSGSSDSSFVTNVGDTVTEKITGYYDGLGNSYSNQNYLALDTEGGTLWRSIGQLTGNNDALGTAREVAATGTYLDTLVQFTVTEDEEPTVGADDKLAIWLQAGEGTTNLMVRAKGWALDGSEPTGAAASFTVSNVAVEPGTWYRLTVKAVQTVINPSTGMIIPAFQIFIDGTEVAATTPQISTEIQDAFTGNNVWVEGMAALASANKLFPSLAEIPAALTDVTLQGVGFQGTGAVDEIVWTEDDPFPAAVVEFTLTYSGDANVTTLGAVTYTIGEVPAETVTFANGEATIVSNATVTITAPTFAQGYQLGTFTVGGTAVSSPTFPYSFTMTADTTVSITSAQITYTLTLPPVEHATPAVTVSGSPASGNTFPVGTEVLVTWTAESGYQITAGATQNITMNSDVTATAPTVEAVASYPTYLTDADATIKGKYDAWKQTYQADTGSQWENAFLLNMDPTTSVAEGTALLKIASITEVSGGWELEIASDATTLTADTNNDGLVGNGYLAITYAADLATLTSGGTTVNLPVTVTNGKIKVTVSAPGAKFMKAKLTTAAETVAGE